MHPEAAMEPIGKPEDYVTVSELAAKLGVHRTSIHRTIKRLRLPTVRSWIKTDSGRQFGVMVSRDAAAEVTKWFGDN
jgi:predicted DNA-binding transcriptional regulator YafY